MIHLPLQCHAATPAFGVRSVQVSLKPAGDGALTLAYELDADPRQLLLPPSESPAFADGLWHHSCFELFVAGSGDAYREFNFSPSSEYAIYDFAQYRAQMTPLHPALPPVIAALPGVSGVTVHLPPALLALRSGLAQALGVAAVIEERGGRLSYWALHHCGPKPDFHRRESFVIDGSSLPAAGVRIS